MDQVQGERPAGFSNTPGNPTKMRADIEPCILDFKINIIDIVRALDGLMKRHAGHEYADYSFCRCGPRIASDKSAGSVKGKEQLCPIHT